MATFIQLKIIERYKMKNILFSSPPQPENAHGIPGVSTLGRAALGQIKTLAVFRIAFFPENE
jgi:hypothetical protein